MRCLDWEKHVLLFVERFSAARLIGGVGLVCVLSALGAVSWVMIGKAD